MDRIKSITVDWAPASRLAYNPSAAPATTNPKTTHSPMDIVLDNRITLQNELNKPIKIGLESSHASSPTLMLAPWPHARKQVI